MLQSVGSHKHPRRFKKRIPAESYDVDPGLLNQLYYISKYARNLFMTTVLGLLFVLSTLYIGSFWIQDDYKEQTSLQRLQDLSSRLLTHALSLRYYEKDFIATEKAKAIDSFREHGDAALRIIDEMKLLMAADSIRSSLDRMHRHIQEHLQNFDLLVAEYRKIGLSETEGLRGEMRKAAHIVEGYLNEDGLAEFMQVFLMIRRYEKNFFLRHYERYLVEVARGIDEFENLVKAAPFKETTKETIHRITEQYREKFNLLASKTLEINRKQEDLERIYEDFSLVLGQVNDYVNGLVDESRKTSVQSLFQFKSSLTLIGLFLLVVSGIYGIRLMRRVTQVVD